MISANTVKELREISGAGMMDCKKALQEANGDIKKAMEVLRKNGIAKAQKKSGRSASDGVIMPYIHPGSKLGVLLEVNCETDFVARTDAFQEFCKDIAMHIAATSPVSVSRDDLDEEIIESEKRIFREQSKKSGKPDEIIEKMIDGRMNKFFQENVLIEQSFVKNPDLSISDLLTETIAKLGENISIARFTRFQLGETAVKSESSDSE
ncbi:MAG: elongation factor Ts [Candidatus Marinimicrobia bacterium]|nr:elongation factor Ts [Candidatus Neomarinimicrobiota bacterium]|tara:strand:+ start:2786 stop:3409 length:624 start_codon:yes stop_codon:yes gene_type:complete